MNGNSAPHAAFRRQYSLADLLLLFAAASVYLAMIVSANPWFVDDYRGKSWPALVTVPMAWCVLWALYRRWRLRQALWIHYSGPVLFVAVIACLGFLAVVTDRPDMHNLPGTVLFVLAGLLIALVFGCGVSSLVSLPMAVWMLILLGMRPLRPEKTP